MTSPDQTPYTPPPVVTPPPESRFEQLVELWTQKKEKLRELTEQVEALSKGIKAEAMASAPAGTSEVILRHPALATPYRIYPREETRLDSKALKQKDRELYDRYATTRTTWRMDPVK